MLFVEFDEDIVESVFVFFCWWRAITIAKGKDINQNRAQQPTDRKMFKIEREIIVWDSRYNRQYCIWLQRRIALILKDFQAKDIQCLQKYCMIEKYVWRNCQSYYRIRSLLHQLQQTIMMSMKRLNTDKKKEKYQSVNKSNVFNEAC